MWEELNANTAKGEWLNLPVDKALEDLVYHVAKLVIAVEKGDKQAIHEYAADVANGAMIVADIEAVVDDAASPKPILLNDVLGIPAKDGDLLFDGKRSEEMINFKTDLDEIAQNLIKRVKTWMLITEAMKDAPIDDPQINTNVNVSF